MILKAKTPLYSSYNRSKEAAQHHTLPHAPAAGGPGLSMSRLEGLSLHKLRHQDRSRTLPRRTAPAPPLNRVRPPRRADGQSPVGACSGGGWLPAAGCAPAAPCPQETAAVRASGPGGDVR